MVVLLLPGNTTRYNLTKEERLAAKRLAEVRSTVIKTADKGFCVVVWDRTDYLIEVKKDLSESNIYKEVKFDDNELVKLVEVSNTLLKRLLLKRCISPEQTNL